MKVKNLFVLVSNINIKPTDTSCIPIPIVIA